MKKFVKLLPALVMLLISAILVSTTTYAWFSMNSQVTATNMKVKAVAEQGIVIADSEKAVWDDSANARYNTSAVALLPTSTPNLAVPTWVHAMSPDADDANPVLYLNSAAGATYEDLTLAWSQTNEGVGYIDSAAGTAGATANAFDSTDRAFVRRDVFFIRAASTDMLGGTLYINDLTVEATGNTDATHTARSSELNKALRVLVVLTESDNTTHSFLFAPIDGATMSYTWKGVPATGTAVTATAAGQHINVDTGIDDVYNAVANAIQVDVYTYFEGEDAALKSTNAGNTVAMDDLNVTIKFGTVATSATP